MSKKILLIFILILSLHARFFMKEVESETSAIVEHHANKAGYSINSGKFLMLFMKQGRDSYNAARNLGDEKLEVVLANFKYLSHLEKRNAIYSFREQCLQGGIDSNPCIWYAMAYATAMAVDEQ